mgnify:CR=1 FL=1
MADPTVYNYTKLDDLKVQSTPAPSFAFDSLNQVMTFKVHWKANGYISGSVNGKYKESGGSYTNMQVVGQSSAGTKTLKGNMRNRLETFQWQVHSDLLPLNHSDLSFKLTFSDESRAIPLAESGTEWTGQSLDMRKQITKFALNDSTSKDAFGHSELPVATFETPQFWTQIYVRPILEKSPDTTFASEVDAQTAWEYYDTGTSAWVSGNASAGNGMTTPLKIKMTASASVADNTKEYFRVRMHPTDFV